MFALLCSLIHLIIGFLESVYHSIVPDVNQHFERSNSSNNNSITYHPYPHLVAMSKNFKNNSLQEQQAFEPQSQITQDHPRTVVTTSDTINSSTSSSSSSIDENTSQAQTTTLSNPQSQEQSTPPIQKIQLHSKLSIPNHHRKFPIFLHKQSSSTRNRLSSASLLCRNVNWNGGNFKE